MTDFNDNRALANPQNVAAVLELMGPATAPEIAQQLADKFPSKFAEKIFSKLRDGYTEEELEFATEEAHVQVAAEVVRSIHGAVTGLTRDFGIKRGFPSTGRMFAYVGE